LGPRRVEYQSLCPIWERRLRRSRSMRRLCPILNLGGSLIANGDCAVWRRDREDGGINSTCGREWRSDQLCRPNRYESVQRRFAFAGHSQSSAPLSPFSQTGLFHAGKANVCSSSASAMIRRRSFIQQGRSTSSLAEHVDPHHPVRAGTLDRSAATGPL
jgi:hypothetical protein